MIEEKLITTVEIIAIYYVRELRRMFYGLSYEECLIHWAISEMRNGGESTNLFALASYSAFSNPFLVEETFLKSLKELKIPLPPQEVAINSFMLGTCKKILNKTGAECHYAKILATIYSCTGLYKGWFDLEHNYYSSQENKVVAIRNYAKKCLKVARYRNKI